jgi:hypothetical protein
MKCGQCGFRNDIKSKFCSQCGFELLSGPDTAQVSTLVELYGKEVDVLFFIESFTGKISGIVNPSEDQIGRYREGVLQRITIESGTNNATDEAVGTIMTFIRQSKEYLSEDFNESYYRNFTPQDLKKEYLKLFERILKVKAQRGDTPKPPPIQKDLNKK